MQSPFQTSMPSLWLMRGVTASVLAAAGLSTMLTHRQRLIRPHDSTLW